MKIITKILIYALTILLAAYILPGIKVTSVGAIIVVAVLLILLNATLKPILKLLTLPINFVTLGCFSLVINAVIVTIVDLLVAEFSIENFLWAIVFGLLLSICVSIFEKEDRKRK